MRVVIFLMLAVLVKTTVGLAETTPKRIGLIASLSGFSATYGSAVRDGAELALEELRQAGESVELIVEDDRSDPSKVLSTYRYLKDLKKIQVLVGGSWWVRPLAQITENDAIPFLSCETMQDRDFIRSKTYFILMGRVSDWVNIYNPFFSKRSLNRGAVVKFTSGFSQTISDEMERLFAEPGRHFVGAFQYQDLQLAEAASIALRLKAAKPDVVYVDGQPEGLANFLRRRAELNLQSIPVVGHSAFEAAITQKLVSPRQSSNLYFLRRTPPSVDFARRFEAKYKRKPILNSDLGYYAVHMAARSLEATDALESLRAGMNFEGKKIVFDPDQIASGTSYTIHRVSEDGEIVPVE